MIVNHRIFRNATHQAAPEAPRDTPTVDHAEMDEADHGRSRPEHGDATGSSHGQHGDHADHDDQADIPGAGAGAR